MTAGKFDNTVQRASERSLSRVNPPFSPEVLGQGCALADSAEHVDVECKRLESLIQAGANVTERGKVENDKELPSYGEHGVANTGVGVFDESYSMGAQHCTGAH